jgi:osmotically-inducible protein OsmY
MQFAFWRRHRTTPDGLERALRRALDGDPRLKDIETSDVFVKTYGGEVILAGIVSTNEGRALVLQVASQVPGVRHVRNKLRTDAELAKALRDRLRSSPVTAIASIEVTILRGVAELRGPAPYDAQIAAIKMARGVDGIRDVVNHLQLSTPISPARSA